MAPPREPSSSQPAVCGSHEQDWEVIDDEFRAIITPVHSALSSEVIGVEEAGEVFSEVLSYHLHQHNLMSDKSFSRNQGDHHERSVVKLTNRLAKAKNLERRSIREDARPFLHAVRLHNRVKKASTNFTSFRSACKQERAFKKNPWSFAKSVCCSKVLVQPTCGPEACFNYFKASFDISNGLEYTSFPSWIVDVMPQSNLDVQFDMSPITPGLIKKILSKLSNSSAPGPDKIRYSHLKRLPSCHHFLATLFSKIILEDYHAPLIWCKGDLRLIHKDGDAGSPENLRPIALTSTVGKLFHKILAFRLEKYLIDNHWIDSKVQKGFLSGISGVLEHILSINGIIENAKSHGSPLYMTFLDFKNAFGSIPHELIIDMLHHIKVPIAISSYVSDMYSKLSASISTKLWSTPEFAITRGVFQGDTLSPMLFLLCFNPIISFIQQLPTCGFYLLLDLDNSIGLPPVNSNIYTKWDEDDSTEPKGWYLCTVKEYLSDGQAEILYRNNSSETVDLRLINWKLARKSAKSFIPISSQPPDHPLKQAREAAKKPKQIKSSCHSVKGYADDLTVLSTSKEDHQSALMEIDFKCHDLGLQLKPEKICSHTTFSLQDGSTRNISSAPTKFLGQTIGVGEQVTRSSAAKKLTNKVYSILDNLDKRPIRGEYKAWIYKFYIVPSIKFNLMVDKISFSVISKVQTKVTSLLKKWLGIPRCATLASLFHPKVINLPYLPHVQDKAKVRLLASVLTSHDNTLREMKALITSLEFGKSQLVLSRTQDVISVAAKSPNQYTSKSLINHLNKDLMYLSGIHILNPCQSNLNFLMWRI